MSSTTLTSLAMLKVNIDQGFDYLDYLRPFTLQVLYDHTPNPVTDVAVRDHIRTDFGLELPERAVQIVLKRLSRKDILAREHGVYHIIEGLPNPNISEEKIKASQHIRTVVASLRAFSQDTARPIASDDEAVQAICAFLAEFNIPCLRAYLRSTAIPTVANHDNALIVLVSKYVLSIQVTDPELFDSFLVVVKGHMLANALLCPDLQKAPKTYKQVTFYFDTPLLVQCLDLEGHEKRAAVEDLIALLRNLGATVAAFSHSRDELDRVIRGSSDYVDSPNGRGAIVMEARKAGTTKSDLLMIAGQIDEKLNAAGIEVIQTPHYDIDFQIDERTFEHVLKDEVWYHNPRAKEDDINSVRSIYVLRSGKSPSNVERAMAVLVTSNNGFAQAAFEYGKDHEASREVSSVITDFSLANMAWLKAPLGAPTLPMTEVIAFSYAALQPPKDLLDKYLNEIDKLEKQSKITESDHQLLRSSEIAQKELMNLTLGDEEALTAQTVTETLSRVVSEIKKEENEKYQTEQAAHRKTLKELELEQTKMKSVQSRLYWYCDRRSNVCAWAVSSVVGFLLVFGLMAGIGLATTHPVFGWILAIGNTVLIITTAVNLIVGATVLSLHSRVKAHCRTWLLRRESALRGLDLGEVQ